MQKFNTLLFFFLLVTSLFGQSNDIVCTGTAVQPENTLILEKQFKKYEVFDLDATRLKEQLSNQTEVLFTLKLGDKTWDLHLLRNQKVSRNRIITVLDEQGQRTYRAEDSPQVWQGYLRRDPSSRVSLTLNDGFIYGMIIEGENNYFIEPASVFTEVEGQQFVVYNGVDVREEMKDFCGAGELEKANKQYLPDTDHDHDHPAETRSLPGCVEVELAVAADWLMFQKYGSTQAVENHIEGVLNNVQTNFDTEFNDELSLITVEYFFSTCSSCDPWTGSTNASTVLNSFTDWGNAGGFNGTYDLASFWTNRDFSGGTIGIAWLSGVCFNTRYHAIQDFSTNASLMRVLVAHEIGHNFSAFHDAPGSGFIMAPSVNNTNSWSNASRNSINNFYPGLFCLGSCGVSTPPVADFSADITEDCAPLTVNFTDLSTNNPTSWEWSFPGGNPAISFDQDPTVTYNTPGIYNVSLTVTNPAGSDTETKTGYIIVNGPPIPDFLYTPLQDTIFFANISQDADTYLWTFGDGDFSTDENPTHIYPFDGDYVVTLEATNECGTESITQTITVVSRPIADFTSTNSLGCDSLTVTFTNRSTPNITSLTWEFPGGTPSISFDPNPTVRYTTPGIYDVRLTVSNSLYTDVDERFDYVDIGARPTAGFVFLDNNLTVDFTSTSTGAQDYNWNFGDGNTSTQQNPTHTYAVGGNYTVTLITQNDCGRDTAINIISLGGAPLADFTSDVYTGCAPLQVIFSDISAPSIISREWYFPGAIPPNSTEASPLVIYEHPGFYDVTLIVFNNLGSDTLTITDYIEVDTVPRANFGAYPNGLVVQFRDSSMYADSLCWDFGDGDSIMLVNNPVHTYDQDGTYNVRLITKNECGRDTIVKPVTVSTLPTADFTVDQESGCATLTANFSSLASANTTSWTWSFPGGNPNTSTSENPTVTYAAAGNYDVTLIVSTAAGSDTLSRVAYISVNDVPAASFSFTINGTIADFTNTSSNATSYFWDFGDGNSSTSTSPSHDYGTDGVYTVTLNATNECGTVSSQQTVTIVTAPTADFTANVTSGCVPLTVNFADASSANTTSWLWRFPGGNPSTSTDRNPVVTYNSEGTYDVELIASNSAGQDLVLRSGFITVNTVPTANFTYVLNGTVASFINTSDNATSYSWDFGDGTSSTETSPTHDFLTDGVYVVILSATNACGTVISQQVVTVVTMPTAGFSANQTSGCAPLTVNFIDGSSANTTSWSWRFPGGNPSFSTDQNPVVTYNSPGTYDVELTVSNSSGQNTLFQSGYITVNDVPSADFSFTVNGFDATFTNQSSNANSYNWDFGDGNSSTDTSPAHTYVLDGVYTVTLSATNECGTVTSQETVTIITPPVGDFTANQTSGCAPMTVQFTDGSSSNTTSWNWTFPGGNPSFSSDPNPVVTYNTAGVYDVQLVVRNSAGQNTVIRTDYIVVNDVPTAAFTYAINGTIVTFNNAATNATSYNWDFGDGNTSTETAPSHDYSTDGVYTVILSATNECGTTTSQQTITIVTAPLAGFTVDQTSGCAPLTVNFTDASSANTTSWNWSFPGGSPSFSTQQNPIVTYSSTGTYDVELTARNSAGQNTVIQAGLIVVNDVPTADFSAIVNGTEAAFTNTSTNATSYNWDFGDGNNSTDANPTHQYSADGTYTVVLIAMNECGSVTTTETVTIVTAPTAGFTVLDQSGCAPFTVQFSDASSDNTTSWSWSFPGGSPTSSTSRTPVVVYSTPGTYTVSLTVSNSAGSDTQIQTDFIVVNDIPSAAFSSSKMDNEVTFTNLSTNATSYLWDFGDGTTSTEISPVHVYGMGGTYRVSLVASNECGNASFVQTVNIEQVTIPLAGFMADVTSGCAPLEVSFTDQSSDNVTSWEWQFEGGTPATSTERNPVVTYTTAGEYTVTLIVRNAAGSNSNSQVAYIVVEEIPTAAFTTQQNNLEVNFFNTSSVTASSATFNWDFGDGGTSVVENPTHVYSQGGTYIVRLIVENNCGADTVITELVVQDNVAPTASIGSSTLSGCVPLTVDFTDLSSGSPTAWEWTADGGDPMTSNEQNPSITFSQIGTFDVQLIASNTFGSDTTFATITVIDVPEAAFTSTVNGADVSFSNNSVSGSGYIWNFGDGSSSTEESPTHTYSSSGTYLVELIVSNTCGADTISSEVVIMLTSTDEQEWVNDLRVFPNPNDGQFQLFIQTRTSEDLQLRMYNVVGQQVFNRMESLASGTLSRSYDLSHLPKGTYLLQLVAGDRYALRKIVIQ